MTKRTTTSVLIGFAIVSICSLIICGIQVTDKNLKREYERFFRSDIDGIIEEIGIKYHRPSFKVRGSKFVFPPNSDGELKKNFFEDFAKVGDSIVKPSHSLTLTLMQKGKAYKYTFTHSVD